MTQTVRCEQIETETEVGLTNGQVELRFDKESGALVSVYNRATEDEYLKDADAEGSPFRIYANITEPCPVKEAIQELALESLGGRAVDPANCRLEDWSFEHVDDAGIITLVLRHAATDLRLELAVKLPDDDVAADCTLTVANDAAQSQTILTSFPYLSGLCLGESREPNLGVMVANSGTAGLPAWHEHWTNFGGVYGGGHMTMQWQAIYEPSKNEGLGFIIMDPDIRNKYMRCYPEARMEVLYFPEDTLQPGEELRYPPVRLLVHQGNWRVVARQYRQWISDAWELRQPPAWLDDVDLYIGPWIPFGEEVAAAQQQPDVPGAFTSFRQLPRLYLNDPHLYDLKEWAMYNSLVLSDAPKEAGHYVHADGTYYPRHDLGGAPALREGVAAAHRIGRRVLFYVEGTIVHKTSELTLGGVGERWMILDEHGQPLDRYPGHWSMCPGCEEWQDHLAEVCKRLLWETGADGIRLDSLGSPWFPCYNPAHNHESPFDWNKWILQLLQKVRAAMDEVNPQTTLWTEHPVDFYGKYCDGALCQRCPGAEVPPVRIACPTSYRLYYYGHRNNGDAGLAALNGLVAENPYLYVKAEDWGWIHGSFGRWKDAGPVTRWPELHATLREAMIYGYPTDVDPQAEDDDKWLGRLWCSPKYWVMIGGHAYIDSEPYNAHSYLDGSPLAGPLRVKLPELPDSVDSAYEFDILTLKMEPAPLERTSEGIFVTVKNTFSAVFLPLPDCPPLIQMDDPSTLVPGQEVTVELTAFAPRRKKLVETNVTVTAPGLEVDGSGEVTLPASVPLKVPEGAEPGKYFISVSGDCLLLKRWVDVRASSSENNNL